MSASAPEAPASATRPRGLPFHRRWWFWTIVLPVAAMVLPVAVHRGLLEYRCARIRGVGGGVSIGPPPIYLELVQDYQQSVFWRGMPRPIRVLCRSTPVEWFFNQFPVAYSVGLRGVRDPDAVGAALETAKCFPDLRGLMLYQSGVRDEHLEGLAASCPRLTRLVINETAVTDRGMSELRGLRRLEYVNAQRTAITDASVAVFAELPRLKELAVGETGITSVELIRERRPESKIHTTLLYTTRCPVCRQLLNECRCPKDQEGASDEG